MKLRDSILWSIGIIVPLGAAFAIVDGWLPYAKDVEIRKVETQHATDVRSLTGQIAGLDVRGLTWQVESIKRQLYEARRACKRGDSDACEELKNILRQLLLAESLLQKQRGF